jgi:transcription initiation factor TFIIA large subunit
MKFNFSPHVAPPSFDFCVFILSMSGRKSARERPRLETMTQALYQTVIDETVGDVKSLFIERGVSEDILRELRALWEDNVSKSGRIGVYMGRTDVKAEENVDADLATAGDKKRQLTETKIGDEGGEPLQKKPRQDEDGDELGSDLDDSEIGELDDVQGADATGKVDDDSSNTVLGAFNRVTRAKNRWKVALQGCVGLYNGHEYLFKKLSLELDWS